MDLKQYREKHGAGSWETLAKKAGTTAAYLMQLAHGHKTPSVAMVNRLIEASGYELTPEAMLPRLFANRPVA